MRAEVFDLYVQKALDIDEVARVMGYPRQELLRIITKWRAEALFPDPRQTRILRAKNWKEPDVPVPPNAEPVPLQDRRANQCAVVLNTGLMCGARLTGDRFRMCSFHAALYIQE